jgi:hypothetical protein
MHVFFREKDPSDICLNERSWLSQRVVFIELRRINIDNCILIIIVFFNNLKCFKIIESFGYLSMIRNYCSRILLDINRND